MAGLSQYLLFGLGLAKAIFLARWVAPEHFGVVVGATVWASYLGVARLELRVTVLRGPDDPRTLGVQFLLENLFALSGLLALAGLALVWPGAMSPPTWGVTAVLLVLAQIETLTSTSTYLAEKRLHQGLLGGLAIAGSLAGGLTAVVLTLLGRPLGALVADVVVSAVVARVGVLAAVGWLPRPAWDAREVRTQLRVGWTLWTSALLGKVVFQFDDWLVYNLHRPHPVAWRAAGVVPAALYVRAYNLAKLPMDVAASMIARTGLALYAEAAGRGGAALAQARAQLTAALAWLVFGFSSFILLAAEEVVSVLGPHWAPAVPLLRMLGLVAIARPLFQNNAQALLAVGGEIALRRTLLAQAGAVVLAGPPAVYAFGAAGAAVVASGTSALGLVLSEEAVGRRLGAGTTWRPYAAPTGAATIATLCVVALVPWLPANPWLSVAVKGLICLGTFGGMLALFGRGIARDAWAAIRGALAAG